MTLTEFLDALAETRGKLDWCLEPTDAYAPDYSIRGYDDDGKQYCPITAVVGDPVGQRFAAYAGAHELNLDPGLALNIVIASDTANVHRLYLMNLVGLRNNLLEATGRIDDD